MPVEPIPDLRRYVGEVERLVHSLLGDFGVRRGYPT
jgi:hypothetical protein